MGAFDVKTFAGILSEAGISEEQMRKIHRVFEAKYPQDHVRFLEWLGADAAAIKKIRSM